MSPSGAEDPRIERLRAHVAWLADPARAGRAVGTAAERTVVLDLARRFAEAGLEPVGEEGFLQPVPLLRAQAGPGAVTLTGPDGEQWAVPDGAAAVRCPGFTGCRTDGEATLARLGPPESPLETTSAALRLERLLREVNGATTLVLVDETDWDEAVAGLRAPRYRPAQESRSGTGQSSPLAVVVDAGAAPPWLRDARPGMRFEVGASATVGVGEATGWNVAGVLPGSDPERAGEAVVLTAHHDHLGTRVIGGDTVLYPGVIDNALSVAELVETARLLAVGPRPPRSIVFLSPTAEEVGFLGTRRWVSHPPPGTPRPVANWNHDGASEAWGRAASTVLVADEGFPLAGLFAAAATEAGVRVVENPFPSEGFFFRSDHYVFAREGIPAALVFLGPVYVARTPEWGAARAAAYLRAAYHQPRDDMAQIATWEGALQFVELWAALARASAEAP